MVKIAWSSSRARFLWFAMMHLYRPHKIADSKRKLLFVWSILLVVGIGSSDTDPALAAGSDLNDTVEAVGAPLSESLATLRDGLTYSSAFRLNDDLEGRTNYSSVFQKSQDPALKAKLPKEIPQFELFKQQVESLDRAILANPDDAAAYFKKAKLFFDLSDWETAAENFEAAALYAGGGNKYVEPSLWQGLCLYQMGDREGALWMAHRVLLENDKCAAAHRLKGVCIVPRDFARGFREIEEAIKLEPGTASFYVSRARALNDNKDYKGALASADKAIALDPAYPHAYFARLEALRKVGQLNLALAAANKVVELVPYSPAAYGERARIYRALRKEEAAARDMAMQRWCKEELDKIND